MTAERHIANAVATLSVSDERHAAVLDGLPAEIRDHIFHFVVADSTPNELKEFRQCCRYFRDRADIYLFATLHISASNLSLQRVQNIAETERLNIHVRQLVFHRGTFSGHKMVRLGNGGGMRPRDYGDYENYIIKAGLWRTNSNNLTNVSKCYDAFIEELRAESDFNRDSSWRWTMRKYFARFPKLEQLTTLSDNSDLLSTYLIKRCGLTYQSWTPNYFAPYEIFEPCDPKFRPKILRLDSANGEDFAMMISNIRGGPAAVADRFSQLQSFHLSFSDTVNSLETEGTYDVFIRSCNNLRELSLDFQSFYSPKMFKNPESFPQRLIKLVLLEHFPNLANLSLTCAPMTEENFISFLSRHANTMRSLVIDWWPMPVTPSGQPTGSVLRALYMIGQTRMPSLRTMQLSGEFSFRADGSGWWLGSSSENEERLDLFDVAPTMMAYLQDGGINNIDFPLPISKADMERARTGDELSDIETKASRVVFPNVTITV